MITHIVLANMLFCHQTHYIFTITFSANFSELKSRPPPICSLLECMRSNLHTTLQKLVFAFIFGDVSLASGRLKE